MLEEGALLERSPKKRKEELLNEKEFIRFLEKLFKRRKEELLNEKIFIRFLEKSYLKYMTKDWIQEHVIEYWSKHENLLKHLKRIKYNDLD